MNASLRNRLVSRFLSAALLVAGLEARAEEPRKELPDNLTPKTRAEDARTFQLHTATLCTADGEGALRFYRDAMGMRARGPVELAPEVRSHQRRLWGIPKEIGWDLYLLDRPGAPGTVQVRLLVLDRETPLIKSDWGGREPGSFSLGFPTTDLETWGGELGEAGYASINPMSRYHVPRPDGTRYGIHETIFKAPDNIHAVGISRRDGMRQLGPVVEANGRGGPVYSAQIIEDSDRVLAFYTDVLGMEIRSDREWKSHGSKGALGLPDGSEFRFSIVYAHGARFGHLLFVDHRGNGLPSNGVPSRPPNRGLTMWSFPVRDLGDTLKRVRAAGVEVVHGPVAYESPALGRHRALTVLAPNGFLVELFQPEGVAVSAKRILHRAVEAAGGESWRRPKTLQLDGRATYFPGGSGDERVLMDEYSMRRVFPDASGAARRANGKVRFHIAREGEVFLSNTFDGETAHYEIGELAKAHERHFAWENNFGFGIIRFADGPGFSLRRLADDQIEGHPCHFVEVTDRAGRKVTFGIDRSGYQIRSVSFDTEVGFHHRVYSDFRWADEGKSFLQPHRVRIYFDGAKWFDIDWLSAIVDQPIPDAVFAANSTSP